MKKENKRIVIEVFLHDFTPVKSDLVIKSNDHTNSTDDTAPPKDSAALKQLKVLFNEPDTDTCINLFCNTINAKLAESPPTAIYYMNHCKPVQKLFFTYNGMQMVKGYAGVLQFDLDGKETPDPQSYRIILNIHSRFDRVEIPVSSDSDAETSEASADAGTGTVHSNRFLMYMFEKGAISRGTIYENMRIPGQQENSWDLMLAVLFITQLKTAMKKSLFRQYREYSYNDCRLRGRIDLARHVRENTLFMGKVAYSTREYTVDNSINVLILHTLHKVEKKYPIMVKNLLLKNDIVRNSLQLLRSEVKNWKTIPSHIAIQNTKKRVANALYRDYETLRLTSHAVLAKLGVNIFSHSEKTTISGMLIDLPNLWEDFLYYAVIQEYSSKSAPYQQHKMPIVGGKRTAKPDFLIPKKGQASQLSGPSKSPYEMVLDAKYKVAWSETYSSNAKTVRRAWKKLRNDVFQILSYSLVFDCKYCGIIFPISQKEFAGKEITPVYVSQFRPGYAFAQLPYVIPEIDPQSEENYREVFARSDKQLVDFLNALKTTPPSLPDTDYIDYDDLVNADEEDEEDDSTDEYDQDEA